MGTLLPAMKRERLLDLNEVLQHPGKKIAVDVSTELANTPEVELMGEMQGYLEAVSTGNLLLLTGEFKARVILDCARCGAPLEVAVEFEVDEQFPVKGVPASYNTGDHARVVPDEPYELFVENALDVDALLRQDILIALPMQPLCQFGWDGPCPKALETQPRQSPPGRPEFAKLQNLVGRETLSEDSES